MSTPVTLKQMEIAREKAARRNRQADSRLHPLSHSYPFRSYVCYPFYEFLKFFFEF